MIPLALSLLVPATSLDEQMLRCARVSFATDSVEEERLEVSQDAPEGASASLWRRGEDARVIVHWLGESMRFRYDFRFVAGALVCATVESTTLHTVVSVLQPGALPPSWRRDEYWLSGEKRLRHAVVEAPGKGHAHPEWSEIRALAARVAEAMAKKQ